MNFKNLKRMVEKWIQGSGEKQLKVFTKSKKSTRIFNTIANKNSPK